MKIRNLLKTTKSIDMDDIPIGVVFSGEIRIIGVVDDISSIFVKGHGVILDLRTPGNTWIIDDKYSTNGKYAVNEVVVDYEPLDVELVVNGHCIINTEEEAQIYAKDIIT